MIAELSLTPEQLAWQAAAADEQSINELGYFAINAWQWVEPGRHLDWGPHLNLVCDEYQEFTEPLWHPDQPKPTWREMVTCVPPRTLKSYLNGICLPAWLWLRSPWVLYQGISNDEKLSSRDALKTLELVRTDWYRRLVCVHHQLQTGEWPDVDPVQWPRDLVWDGETPWDISDKQAEKVNYLNTMGGGRLALGVNSKITGKGADLQCIDDPYDAAEAAIGNPEQVKRRMLEIREKYKHVWKSRLNHPTQSLRMVTMQRVEREDLAGELIKKANAGKPVKKLVLPMAFDPDFPEEFGGVHPKDWRTKKGETLIPSRWDAEWWEEMTGTEGSVNRHVLAQYQQMPQVLEGSLFKRHMFARRYKEDPRFVRCDEYAIYSDLTFKDGKDTDFVVIQVWGRIGKARFRLLDQMRKQMGFVETVKMILAIKAKWPLVTKVGIEAKANGSAVVDLLRYEIPGIVEIDPGTKGKYERAQVGSAPPLEAGQVEYPSDEYAPWMPGYVDRHIAFDGRPGGVDDEIDTTSMALLDMAGPRKDPLERLRNQFPEM